MDVDALVERLIDSAKHWANETDTRLEAAAALLALRAERDALRELLRRSWRIPAHDPSVANLHTEVDAALSPAEQPKERQMTADERGMMDAALWNSVEIVDAGSAEQPKEASRE